LRRLQAKLAEQLGEEGRVREAALQEAMEGVTVRAERDRLIAQLGRLYMSAESYDRLPDDPSDADDERPADAAGNRETWGDVLRLQQEGVEPAAFAAIRAPVLMLHGDRDPHPGAATRDRLLPFLPHLKYVEYARCGHEPWQERHAREAFLARLRDGLRV
jgi:pimeloyl-ACP methyl ester carboxylesterase